MMIEKRFKNMLKFKKTIKNSNEFVMALQTEPMLLVARVLTAEGTTDIEKGKFFSETGKTLAGVVLDWLSLMQEEGKIDAKTLNILIAEVKLGVEHMEVFGKGEKDKESERRERFGF